MNRGTQLSTPQPPPGQHSPLTGLWCRAQLVSSSLQPPQPHLPGTLWQGSPLCSGAWLPPLPLLPSLTPCPPRPPQPNGSPRALQPHQAAVPVSVLGPHASCFSWSHGFNSRPRHPNALRSVPWTPQGPLFQHIPKRTHRCPQPVPPPPHPRSGGGGAPFTCGPGREAGPAPVPPSLTPSPPGPPSGWAGGRSSTPSLRQG